MAKTKAPAAMDDDTFMLEEMRLRLECLRQALSASDGGADSSLALAARYWRFVSDADIEEPTDADA